MVKIFKHEAEQGWFVADESGTILIDGCPDLEAAIVARLKLRPFGRFAEQREGESELTACLRQETF